MSGLIHTDTAKRFAPIPAEAVVPSLSRHMLIDGFTEFILDPANSKGSYLRDARTGEDYLDFFTFFASNALGMNHPKMQDDEFREFLLEAAMHKPSNSDMYTEIMARFVDNFSTIAKPEHFKYLFFVEGGSVAVENALKVAFDWKIRKNFQKGHTTEKGTKILHFREAFHGRTGYTLSLTNTDPNKIALFPKFDWPRVLNPKIKFPLESNLSSVLQSEDESISQILKAIAENPDDIAAIIIEPIQCEGGDNFFRKEFLSRLRSIADENDILLIFDEVQTGFGITGQWWAAEHYVMPDIISFGKKVQVCGIMASERLDEVEEHCFRKSSRINSTWGGNLTDMARASRIMEIMHEDNVVENARKQGEYLLQRLFELQSEFPSMVSAARGKGLLCSFDLPDAAARTQFLQTLYANKMIMLGCGARSVRFRTALTVDEEILERGLKIIRNTLISLA